jgi:hypothetical protein
LIDEVSTVDKRLFVIQQQVFVTRGDHIIMKDTSIDRFRCLLDKETAIRW